MENADLIIKSVGGLTYGGLFILAILSNVVIPIPEELILLTVGYLTGIGIFKYTIAYVIFVAGMLVSDYLLYSLAFKGSKLTHNLRLRLEQKGILKNEEYLRKNIYKIIFFSRFLIYLRFIGPVVSGYLKIPRKTFFKYDLIALVIYVNVFLGLGNYFHKQINFIVDGVGKFKNYLLILLSIIFVITVFRYIQKNFMTWISKIGEFIPTIIPGGEQKDEQL